MDIQCHAHEMTQAIEFRGDHRLARQLAAIIERDAQTIRQMLDKRMAL